MPIISATMFLQMQAISKLGFDGGRRRWRWLEFVGSCYKREKKNYESYYFIDCEKSELQEYLYTWIRVQVTRNKLTNLSKIKDKHN